MCVSCHNALLDSFCCLPGLGGGSLVVFVWFFFDPEVEGSGVGSRRSWPGGATIRAKSIRVVGCRVEYSCVAVCPRTSF